MKAMIIGSGVGGLCAALALQQNDVEVAMYEGSPEPRTAGAGLALWANAIHALRQLGTTDVIATSAADAAGAIHRWDGAVLSTMDARVLAARYGATSIGVHREELMHALLARVGPVVHFGKRLERYVQDAAGITAHFADGTRTTGDLLIGADGLHSKVRAQMHPAAHPVYRGYAAWRGVIDFPHARVGNLWGESWGRGSRFGLVPLSRDRLYWFATANRPANTPPADHKAELMRLFGGWHTPIRNVIVATPDDRVLYNDIADIEPLPFWVDGRAVLLGDAAHAMTPNMGQGACQAIEDALALSQALRRHRQPDKALAAYQTARIGHTRRVQLRSRSIGRMGQLANPLLAALRDIVVRATPPAVTLQQFDFALGHVGERTQLV